MCERCVSGVWLCSNKYIYNKRHGAGFDHRLKFATSVVEDKTAQAWEPYFLGSSSDFAIY